MSQNHPAAPSLGRLLISHITLRGPELAQLYALIARSPGLSYDDIAAALVPARGGAADFGLAEAPLREALNFLLVAGLAEQRGSSRRRATFAATPRLQRAAFPLLLLHQIRAHADIRQRAIALAHAQLVAEGALAVTALELRERMERGPHRGLFVWTGEKIALWTHIASYVGLARRLERSPQVLLVPQPALVLAALRWCAAQLPDASDLDRCLQAIEETFFACLTARGAVHPGLAQTLVALHRLGQIRLAHSADAARSRLLGEWRVSNVALVGAGEVPA